MPFFLCFWNNYILPQGISYIPSFLYSFIFFVYGHGGANHALEVTRVTPALDLYPGGISILSWRGPVNSPGDFIHPNCTYFEEVLRGHGGAGRP